MHSAVENGSKGLQFIISDETTKTISKIIEAIHIAIIDQPR